MLIDFMDLAAQCAPNIHVTTLMSIVQHESAANPYAIGINSQDRDVMLPRQPQNKDEAIAMAEWLMANGHDFDAGLGQVNIRNIETLGMRISDLFDPCTNLRGIATILTDCYQRALVQYDAGQPALTAALSCYNTGNFSAGFDNGYVRKVSKNAAVQIPALMVNDMQQAKSEENVSDAFSQKKNDAFSQSVTKQTAQTVQTTLTFTEKGTEAS